MKGRNLIRAALLVAALALVGAGQAWAIGTASDTTISNKASVTFTINAKTTSVDSNTETFEVDRKIRPVVDWQDTANVSVIAGANDFALKFWVTNESNTAAGSDYFKLTVQQDAVDFPVSNVRIFLDDGDGSFDAGDTNITATPIVSISNADGANTATYFIVADIPTTDPDAYVAGKLSSVHLVATAWTGATEGTGALTGFAYGTGSNDPDTVENVYADDAGSATGDTAYQGQHSDMGTYMVATPITVTKDAGDGTSGYHIPGDEVTYTISITNTDTDYDATAVTIYDEIPANVKFKRTSLSCPSGFTAEFSTAVKGSVPAPAAWSTTDPALVGTPAASPVNHVRCTGGTVAQDNGTASITFTVIID